MRTRAADPKKALQATRQQMLAVQALHMRRCGMDERGDAAAGCVALAARLVGQVPGMDDWVSPAAWHATQQWLLRHSVGRLVHERASEVLLPG